MDDNKSYFIDKPEVFNWFNPNNYTELIVRNIGYHNFAYISPWRYMRSQAVHTLHFVISGKGYLYLNDKRYELAAGDVFYLDDKSLFSYYPDQNDPWEYVFFEFYGTQATTALEGTPLTINTPVAKANNPFTVRKYLHAAFETNSLNYAYVVSAFFNLINDLIPVEKRTDKHQRTDFIEEVKSYISLKFFDSEFSVEGLCKTFFISHSHLCRLFKRHENVPVITYIKSLRLAHSAQLLTETDYSLKDVAMMSGFKEYEYFFRSFKIFYGKTPTDYRLENRKSD